jgi:hypothetical protein
MRILLAIALLFAQVQTSTFVRPTFPHDFEWKAQHKKSVIRQVDFVMPASGERRFDYQEIYPCTYDGDTCKAIPQECDHHDVQLVREKKKGDWSLLPTCDGGNQKPIYDIEESYDHVTLKAEPGTMWRFFLILAVPE